MSDFERLTDTELINAFRLGDSDAFANIYDRYADTIFSTFLVMGHDRHDALEATHDTFLEVADRLEGLESPDDLEEWILGIAAGMAGSEEIPQAPHDLEPAPPALRARVLGKVDRRVGVPAPTPIGTTTPEWMEIGIFAVVTLFVGLIGLAVSASFEPVDSPPATTVTQSTPVAEGSTTTTTSAPSPSTTRAETTTTSAQPEGASASIEASTDSVDLGESETAAEFELRNTGDQAGEWELASSSEAIAVSAGRGELSGGQAVTIELSVDRAEIGEGEIAETLTLTWEGGQIEVAVVGSHEDNPVIHNPQASPSAVEVSGGSECADTQTTVTARIRDTSPLESVVVRWSPDGSGEEETEMASVGNDMFEGVVGPFTVAQTTDVRIVAFDDRGNAGGASTSLSVVDCP